MCRIVTARARRALTVVKRRWPTRGEVTYSVAMVPFTASRRPRAWLVPLLCASGLLAAGASHADARADKVNFVIAGTVQSVEDGDTLTLRGAGGGRFHVRLSDLDAPETAHARNPHRERRGCRKAPDAVPAQPQAEASRAALAARAPRKAAARAECYVIDRYGRPVCHVFVGTTNLNLAQLRDGQAMLIGRRAWVRDPASAEAEQDARRARRGIWAGAAPQSPDDWRQRCWCQASCGAAAP